MAAEPLDEPDLTARLPRAIKSCEASWKQVDSVLYDLCHRRPRHDDFADVYTKVAIIGRLHEAGVARAWRGEGGPETEITRVLIEQADLIQSGLQRLGATLAARCARQCQRTRTRSGPASSPHAGLTCHVTLGEQAASNSGKKPGPDQAPS